MLLCDLALPLTDDARNQRETVWSQPQSQVHGLMVDSEKQFTHGELSVTSDITLVSLYNKPLRFYMLNNMDALYVCIHIKSNNSTNALVCRCFQSCVFSSQNKYALPAHL